MCALRRQTSVWNAWRKFFLQSISPYCTVPSRLKLNRYIGISGFSAGIAGVYWASCSGGLNFKISPKYCQEGSLQDNMKAMIISLMMSDKLSQDEISILTNSVESICDKDNFSGKCCSDRESWCVSEIKNFMDCSAKYADFKDDRCKTYRMLLKNCLQAKKDGLALEDLGQRYKVPPSFKNKHSDKPECSVNVHGVSTTSPECSKNNESVPVESKSCQTVDNSRCPSHCAEYHSQLRSEKEFNDAATYTE